MLSSLWKMLGYAIPSAKRPDKYYYLSLIYENYIWSIHGLWPQYADGSYPSYCKKVFFDLQALQPIIDKLNIKRSEIPAVTHVDYSARIQTKLRA